MHNFCRTKRKIFLSLLHQFCAKKQQFAQSFAKFFSRKIALFRFCETQVFCNYKFCAISQKSKGCLRCFLEFNSSSAGRFCTKIRNRLSSKSLEIFGHTYFLNVDSSQVTILRKIHGNSQESFLGIRRNSQESFTGNFSENVDSYSEEFLVTHSEEPGLRNFL